MFWKRNFDFEMIKVPSKHQSLNEYDVEKDQVAIFIIANDMYLILHDACIFGRIIKYLKKSNLKCICKICIKHDAYLKLYPKKYQGIRPPLYRDG